MIFSPSEHIVLALVMSQAGFIDCQDVSVRFTKQNYGALNETAGAFTTLSIEKDGEFGSDFTVIIQVENQTSDLKTNSWTVAFLKTDSASVKSFNVFVAEDDIPEEDEVVRFSIRSLIAIRIGEPSIAELTILANDDAHGIIGFDTLSPVQVDEESNKNASVTLSLLRQRGRFGDVSVTYEISRPESYEKDIFPLQGTVTMSQGEYKKDLHLEVIDDQIPEDAEQFQVTLRDTTGGLKIDETSRSVSIVVKSNDSPLRFSQKVYRVEEDAKFLEVVVFRGLDKKGISRIGPDQGSVWVKYATVQGTATPDLDYHLQSSGTFSFSDQEHKATMKVFILEDDIPELSENFTIHLLADDKYGDVIVTDPSSCTVVIETNDNAKGVLSIDFDKAQDDSDFFVINEDEMTEFLNISVARHGGSFSEVTIQWVLVANSSKDEAVDDVRPTSGLLVFQPGQTQAEVALTVVQDNTPEEAKSVIFRLLPDSLQGGAIVEEPTEAFVVIADSDDVYGVFSVDDGNSRIEINELQRNLVVGVTRAGRTTGAVNLEYSVYYLPPGVNDIKQSMPGITSVSEGSLLFAETEATKEIIVEIEKNAFLELGSSFFLVLNSVNLIGRETVIPASTPRITSGNVTVNVTEQFANGEIGFRNQTPIRVSEPADDENSLDVVLELHRQGLSGPATVQISYRSLGDNAVDVIEGLDYLKGPDVVQFQPGERLHQIKIEILSDQIPEIEEKILIRLDSVEPGNQKLKSSQSEMQVIIAENDSPGGVFSFSDQTPAHYVIQEKETESVIVTVQRTKGSLASRMITYDVIPDGSQQFYAVPDTLVFPPGKTSATIALVPIDDVIPELDINYTLVILSDEREGTVQSVLAPPTSVQVTVLANDYPHGLFVFANEDDTPKLQSIGESKANRNSSAYYRVRRTMGTYGDVSVSWKVMPDDTNDVTPTEGILYFSEGDTELILSMQSARDEIPESLEEFSLHLFNATGGAMIEQGENATLIIEPNDKAIFFDNPSVVKVKEGDYLKLTIHRKGTGSDATSVRFRTRVVSLNDSLEQHIATPNDDFEEAIDNEVTFRPGVLDMDIKVFIVDDSIPEDDESFFVELYSAEHDYVTSGNDNVEVIILQSDDANGVFFFGSPNEVEMEEGKPFSLPIRRDKGAFGDVSLHWKILRGHNMTYTSFQENSLIDEKLDEFLQSDGEIKFKEGILTKDLILEALADSKPEYEEYFTLALLNVTFGQASLSQNLSSLMVRIVVKTNDHPYGLMSFVNATTPILLPEDGDVEHELTVEVVREMGSDGNIQVLWEVLHFNSSLPSKCKDLILAGELLGSAAYTQGRPHTDTPAVNFAADSSVLIKSSRTNTKVSSQGFSLLLWMKFNSSLPASVAESTLCKILSKSEDGNSTIFLLSLKKQAVQIDNLEVKVRLNSGHSLQSMSLNLEFNKTNIWHHLVVSFGDDIITAYSEGKLVDSKQLDTSLIGDAFSGGDYIILGPDYNINNAIIDYDLQDVRLYNVTLKPNQVNELFVMPARSDLFPISGYLKYDHNVRTANFTLQSIDDLDIENNENFQLVLMDATGGAAVNQDNGSITLTVLKSDNANGLFSFSQPCQPDHVTEGQSFICFINRSRGYDGDVMVQWKATYNQSEGDDKDFDHFEGEVKFFHGEREKSFNITTIDDKIPEINEVHSITLINAASLDDVSSSTPSSGASIDKHLATSFLSILANDKPNGVLQFSDTSPPTLEENGKIPERDEPLVVHVAEEDDQVILMVVRAGGWFGHVTSEWRTRDGTAISNQEPKDFESSAGTLSFDDGQGYASLTLTLVDDDVSELEKYFYVELTTATGGASFNNASRVKIIIDPSDNAFGVFNFNQSSRQMEEPDAGTSTVRLQVLRSGGHLGETTIDWQIRHNASDDLSPNQGQLHFIEGQTTDDIFINVLADHVPEFDEDFKIDLVQVTQGALGAVKTCTLTVLANDDPRGVVIFDPISISAREENKNVTLTIRRSEGLAGTIRVYYTTMDTFVNSSLSQGVAVSGQDFQQVMDSVLIDENVTTVNVSVNLFDDDIPETNEIFFVELLSTEMVSSGVEVPNSPRLGTGRAIMTEVSIVENDNPHGILELSSSSVKVDEDSDAVNATKSFQKNDEMKGFVNVVRRLGTFGDVTVRFNVIPNSATANEDYNVVSSEVTLLDGESSKFVPIYIVNDITPEIEEDFLIELLPDSVTGGARVGDEDTCRVTINESDDPYGLFELSVDKDRVEEPASGQRTPVTFTVHRRNGDRSVVSLKWKVDVSPASSAAEGGNGQGEYAARSNRDVDNLEGLIYFTTGEVTKHFTIKILPDDIPEDDELVVVRLEDISPGHRGRINPDRNEVQVLVPANDRPYGDVSLQNHAYLAHEETSNNFVTVIANRRELECSDELGELTNYANRLTLELCNRSRQKCDDGGLYGTVRVIYSTSEIDLVTEMLENEENLITRYVTPRIVDNIESTVVFQSVDIISSDNPLVTCAEECLRERVCQAFLYQEMSYSCKWTTGDSLERGYITYTSDDVTLTPSQLASRYSLYEKNLTQTSILYNSQARSGIDFIPQSGASVLLHPGQQSAFINITIQDDNEPELSEYFKVAILDVIMVDFEPLSSNLPRIRSPSTTRITIEENDHPYGMFVLRTQGSSSNPSDPIEVEEKDKLSVELLVERKGGSIGDVTVDWSVTGGTASRNNDFIGDDATLKFSHGETIKKISLSIIDDSTPEPSESINIRLSNPTNGAVLNDEQDHSVVTILANDVVGGIIGFKSNSRSVIGQEGESITLHLSRSEPALGRCHVSWHGESVGDNDITNGLNVTQGVITFESGQFEAQLKIQINSDDIPESKEEYRIVLNQVETSDIASSGAAILNPQSSASEISIQESDDPHGIFRFAPTFQRINIKENDEKLEIVISRQFGSIGTVRVYYDIISEILSTINPDIDVATPGSDFTYPLSNYVTFDDGKTSAAIEMQIVDDDVPELMEIFYVNLTYARLIGPDGYDVTPLLPPKIDESSSLAQVVIDANDGTKGVVSFDDSSSNVLTTEGSVVTLRIIRKRGTYGQVTVFVYPQNNQAKVEEDYSCQPVTVTLADSQDSVLYDITIVDDDIPEGNESFQVLLDSPSPGLELGNLTSVTVTIQSNDDAHGKLSFDNDFEITLDEPAGPNITSSKAELYVKRSPPDGVFGQVSVRYKVQQISSSGDFIDSHVSDLTPADGYVVIENGNSFGVIEISAVADDAAELEERFLVTLHDPENGATLDNTATSTEIVIRENDAPYGEFQVFPSGLRNESRNYRISEDTDKLLQVDVVRRQGALGFVTVDVKTTQDTAMPLVPSDTYPPLLAPSQIFPRSNGVWFHSFESNGVIYLVYLTPILALPLSSPVGSSGSLTTLTANVYSTLYKWTGVYTPVQSIETDGASCATTFTAEGVHYLFIANSGIERRRETFSRLYKVTDAGNLLVVQDIPTKGASYVVHFNTTDHYLIIANSMDNNMVSTVDSVVLRFNAITRLLEEVQSLPTRGASGLVVFNLNNSTYLAVANRFDSEIGNDAPVASVVYKWNPATSSFTQPATMVVTNAVDVQHYSSGEHSFLIFASAVERQTRIASNMNDHAVEVYQVVQNDRHGNRLLRSHQSLKVTRPRRIEVMTSTVDMLDARGRVSPSFLKNNEFTMLMVSSDVSSRIFVFNFSSSFFEPLLDAMPSVHIYPHKIVNAFRSHVVVAVAVDDTMMQLNPASLDRSMYQALDYTQFTISGIYDICNLHTGSLSYAKQRPEGDFIETTNTLTFEPGQTVHTLAVTILNDNISEEDEVFKITLSNQNDARAIINDITSNLNVIIEANDDAFGVIGFSEDSIEKSVKETASDNDFTLNVVRRSATFGKVVVDWSAEGSINDVTPVSGQITFEEGQSIVGIQLAVLADDFPEVEEIVEIQLLHVRVIGYASSSVQPRLNMTTSRSQVRILANDSPHGVVSWAPNSLRKVVSEAQTPQGASRLITLDLIREQGAMGDIEVHFKTTRAKNLPFRSQAIPDVDFISRDANLVMKENSTRAAASFSILPDEIPEDKESFYIVIDDVTLIGESEIEGLPGIGADGNDVAEVTIDENDNARGFIQFNVTRNEEGAVDAFELPRTNNTVKLPLMRLVGFVHSVGVEWIARPVTAMNTDFFPSSGSVEFMDGEKSSEIEIFIIDDEKVEFMESFTVQLVATTGGAQLGGDLTVTVNILPNDSPSGMFGFLQESQTVEESTSSDDPRGVVVYQVKRFQGSNEDVTLLWKLEESAHADVSPVSGKLEFSAGTRSKSITLRTLPDNELEGEEKYDLRLISATGGAEISPIAGVAKVVVAANPGAAGVVSLQTGTLFISEPESGIDKVFKIGLQRTFSMFGTVTVDWQIIPADQKAFKRVQGQATFEDFQNETTIYLQTLDDDIPEQAQEYVLRLVAVSGGAELGSGENSCLLTVVASDNPHGVFTFLQPIYHVREGKSDQASIPSSSETPSQSSSYASVRLLRNKGAMSEVAVQVTTSPGSALQNVDYYPVSRRLIFTEGEAMKVINIEIIDDRLPEGPKEFFINMTDIELLSYDKNDFLIHSPFNLSRDIFPMFGDITWSVVRIAKSDGAEGLVEFASVDGSIKVREEAENVKVALIRHEGDYGDISVTVNSLNRTAKRNVDFLMPSTGIEVPFEDGQTEASVTILLVDDSLMEHDEEFTLALTTTSGGARIGDNKFLEVTILKSDYPNGVIRFLGENDVSIANPLATSAGRLKFTLERFGGNQGAISVRWRISRAEPIIAPTTSVSPLEEDISSPTSGVYTFQDGQGGRRDIFVNVLPTNDAQEVEEHFVISIEDPSPAEVSKERGNATITVRKKGHPNGVVKFGRSDEQNQPNQRLETDEPLSGTTQLVFPITRFLGSLGQLNVTWSLSGRNQGFGANGDDVTATTGFVLIYDGQLDAEILINVVADDLPELDETFFLTLLSVDGGSEIDRRNSNRAFMIRANDDPHGIFHLETENQQIAVEPDMKRLLQVNVTRDQGSFGRVVVGFSLQFNKPSPGVSYVTTNSGTAVFADDAKWATEAIEISSSVFLQVGESFTVKLITVEFIGGDVRIKPKISSSEASVNVKVTEEVANSRVGFNNLVAHVYDVTANLCTLNITREGLFGDVTAYWAFGYLPQDVPSGVDQGRFLPSSGDATINHMEKSINFDVTLLPSTSIRPGYAVHITRLQSSIGGGAKKMSDHDTVEIDPCGAIRFSPLSQRIVVGQNTPEVNITVERLYGVRYDVEVDFVVLPVSASPNVHYLTPLSNKIVIPSGENKNSIVIPLIESSLERSKIFRVNLTSAKQPQNIYEGLSPRIIAGQHSSHVTISESPDARGVFSFRDAVIHTAENNNDGSGVSILLVDVERTGTTGDVSVVASTFENKNLLNGFDKSSTSGSSANQAIRRKVLQMAAEERTKRATSGVDYEMHQFNITFPDGTERRSVAIVILDDAVSEPAESFFVFLHSPTGGAKVSADGGVAKIIIDPNDVPNGVVGFVAEDYSIDEDTSRKANIKMSRTNAFGDVTINWRALSSLPTSNDIPPKQNSGTMDLNGVPPTLDKNIINLEDQLQTTQGSMTCLAHQRECFVELTLKDDTVAEFSVTFYLEIYEVSEGAEIDEDRKFTNVTIKDSDSPFGLFQFASSSRFPVVTKDSKSVGLTIERQGGIDTSASVRYATRQLRRVTTIAGATLYPAEAGVDYVTKSQDIVFERGEREAYVTVELKPDSTSANPLPLLFQVVLDWSSGNSQLSATYHVANVTIARDATVKRVWRVYETLQQDLDETVMQEAISQLSHLADDNLDNEKIKIFHSSLDRVIEEGRKTKLSNALLEKTYQLFCKLLSPDRTDAVRGYSDFSESFDQFALCMTTQSECVTSDVATTVMTSCKHAMIQTSRWYPELINGYVFNGPGKDFFQIPQDLLDVARHGADSQYPRCFDIYFIVYSSATWFEVEEEKSPMSDKVFSVGVDKEGISSLSTPVRYRVYTTDARISPQQAECVLWRQASSRWLSTSHGTCHVIDDTSNFVECACNHMSVYAARGPTDNLANYNEATYAACFISMFGFLVTLLAHHLCTRRSKMASKLLMHMCFACAATQLVFAIGALKSADVNKDACSTLAIFLHYFWLAQFTWMFIQSVNILQVLSFSNENTDRRLSVFFIFGWGIPAVIILLYVIVMYALGNASLHNIYGDVYSNGVMCTIMSPNGALLSAVVPATVCVLIVVTIAVHLYQKEGEWKRFDDVYFGKFNSTEVPLLYWLFFFVSITWLWGGLHLAYGQLWMLILFVVCNFLQGFYILVTYGILHSPILHNAKDLYDGGLDKPEQMTHENPAYETAVLDGVASVAGDIMNRSTQSLMKFDDGIWESIENSVDDDNAIDCNDENAVDFEDLMSALKEEDTLDAARLDETKPQIAELNVQQYMTSSMMSPDPDLNIETRAAASLQPDRKVFSLSDTHL